MQDDAGMTKKAEEYSEHGKTPVFFQKNGRFLGILAIADEIKPGWTRWLQRLYMQIFHKSILKEFGAIYTIFICLGSKPCRKRESFFYKAVIDFFSDWRHKNIYDCWNLIV